MKPTENPRTPSPAPDASNGSLPPRRPFPSLRKLFRIVLALCLLAAAIPALYLTWRWATLPRYQGKTVSYWYDQANPGRFYSRKPLSLATWQEFEYQRERAREAFREMGGEAAFFLVNQQRNMGSMPWYNRLLARYEQRLPSFARDWLMYRRRNRDYGAANELLSAMGTNILSAEQEILDWLNERPSEFVLRFIEQMGPAATNSIPHVARLLHHSSEPLRNRAASVLGKLLPSRHPIAADLRHAVRDGRIRPSTGIYALRAIDVPIDRLLPYLCEQLAHPSHWWDALSCLRSLGPEKNLALPELHRVLKNPNPRFRAAILRALADFDSAGAGALDTAIIALSDEFYYVRAEAAHALGRMGARARPALPHLRRLASDSHPDVPEAAAHAINQIENPDASDDPPKPTAAPPK